MAATIFPKGVRISVAGQPVQKPFGLMPTEAFYCETLNPMSADQIIDTLMALYCGLQPTKPIHITFPGVDNYNGRIHNFGSFGLTFSPETGFCENGETLLPEDFHSRVSEYLTADSIH